MREVNFKDFATVAKRRGHTFESLADRFREFYSQELHYFQDSNQKHRQCACGCGQPVGRTYSVTPQNDEDFTWCRRALGVKKYKFDSKGNPIKHPETSKNYYEIEYDTASIRFWIERFVPASKQTTALDPDSSPELFFQPLEDARRKKEEEARTIETTALPVPKDGGNDGE